MILDTYHSIVLISTLFVHCILFGLGLYVRHIVYCNWLLYRKCNVLMTLILSEIHCYALLYVVAKIKKLTVQDRQRTHSHVKHWRRPLGRIIWPDRSDTKSIAISILLHFLRCLYIIVIIIRFGLDCYASRILLNG